MSTKIEWTNLLPGQKGEVWNPVTGCSKVSAGCKNCYAEVMAQRFWKGRKFTDVQCHKDRLEIPLHWRKPRLVFVNSMSDLFHENVPFKFIHEVYNIMNRGVWNNHIFLILTKRPERAKEFYEWFNRLIVKKLNAFKTPEAAVRESIEKYNFKNIWLGVSVENQETADKRIPILLEIPVAIRWVSLEPLLGEVDLTKIDYKFNGGMNVLTGFPHKKEYFKKFDIPEIRNVANLDWVVLGGESGRGARPMHPDWVRKVRDVCKAANVPFFFKQWGEWVSPHQSYKLFSERRKLKHLLMDSNGNLKELSNESIKNLDFNFRVIFKIGKKAAGRLLDGQAYNEYPVIK